MKRQATGKERAKITGDSTTFRELHNGQEEQEKINTQARKMRPPTAPTWF